MFYHKSCLLYLVFLKGLIILGGVQAFSFSFGISPNSLRSDVFHHMASPKQYDFEIVVENRALRKSRSDGREAHIFVETAFVADLFLESLGAQSVVATKKCSDGTAQDVFDEPYVHAELNDHQRNKLVDSLDLLPKQDVIPETSSTRHLWDQSKIIARFVNSNVEPEISAASIINALEGFLTEDDDDIIQLRYRVESINALDEKNIDWCEELEKNWPPSLLIGGDTSQLNVVPVLATLTFHSHEDCQNIVGEGNAYEKIVLEGGSSFGTGYHPTAQLCAKWIFDVFEREHLNVRNNYRVLDYGSGSGILSFLVLLAARRVGIDGNIKVEGVEVDPVAIEAARRNCNLNDFIEPSQVEFFAPMKGSPGSELWDTITGAISKDPYEVASSLPQNRVGTYDIIMANIIAQSLISLASTLATLAKVGCGRILLSGLQENQIQAVMHAYSPYFENFKIFGAIDEWVVLEGTRKPGD